MMKNDFSKGPVWKNIVKQAVPLTIAQLIQLLYNVVDRIYIGHMDNGNSLALTGVGLTFPIVTLIMAFTALTGAGSHFMIGGMPQLLPLILCIGFTLLWARIAAKFANKASAITLNRATGVVLAILGGAIFLVNLFR